MTQETQRHEITKKGVVYQIPGMDEVTVRRGIEYRTADAEALTMDIYYPPDASSGIRLPAVIFAIGYSDLGAQAFLGCRFKEMESFISWGKLTAASGMLAITYATGKDPVVDIQSVLEYIRQHADSLGIDEKRVGLWACSGHVPLALSVLMNEDGNEVKCAVLCYGYLLDLEGATGVADAAKQFRFVNASEGKSVAELPKALPLCIVRAGQDQMPHLNESLDRFVAEALSCNLPITLVNYPAAPHAFDLHDDSEASREIIRQILAFMRFHLNG
jgi:dienelactone hydrolase